MRKIFEAELNRIRCEVPVVITTRKELLDKYIYDPDCMRSDGIFYPDGFFIFIYKNMPYYRKLWVLLHEFGHYLCWRDKCYCFRYDDTVTIFQYACLEYHAHRYALKYLRKKKYKQSENDCIQRIKSYKRSDDEKEKKAFRIVHKKAVRARLIRG
jgi:Zn-dependent peptidase ImmA (M78 family)